MQPVYSYLNQFVLRHVSAAKSLFVEEQSVSVSVVPAAW